MKSFQKKLSGKNQAGPGFNSPSVFRAVRSQFSGGKASQSGKIQNTLKFNPAQFKTQHKG